MDNLVTAQRVAEYLGVSPITVDKLVKFDGLPCSRIGTLKRYDMDMVRQWARDQTNAPAPAPRKRRVPAEKRAESSGAPQADPIDTGETSSDFI